MSHEERRAHQRIEVRFSGTVSFKAEGREWQEAVEAKDFSTGGVYLVGDACPGVDEPISIHLHLSESGAVFKATGAVVRIDQLPESTCGFAVQFDKIPDVHGRKVDRRHIKRRAVERVALPLKGTAVLDIGGELHEGEVTTKDLSVDGAYFMTDLCPSPSDRVSLCLTLVEGEALFETSGTVVRVDPISENSFGVAVKFDKAQKVD